MASQNISPAEMHTLLEMIINSPVGSYINALRRQPLVNKFVELHNAVQKGAILDALSATEAEAVAVLRVPAPFGNTGPAAQAEGIVAPEPQPPAV
jgi:hypothetical protein